MITTNPNHKHTYDADGNGGLPSMRIKQKYHSRIFKEQ